MTEIGTIYKIENLVNGKAYVGQTVRDFKTRIYEHFYKLNNNTHYNPHLQSAWNKYGEGNFLAKKIVESPIYELDKLEQEYIEYYEAKRMSYNIESGGNESKTLSKETIKKIVEQSYKPVILLNTKEEFNSIKEASEKYGVLDSGITSCCKGDRQHAGRLENGEWMVWRYKEDYNGNEEVSFKKHTANNNKKVICINTMEIFNSGKEAGKRYGINPRNVNSNCRGERKSCFSEGGQRLQFEFYREGESYNLIKLEDLHEVKRVVCTTTNETFDSIYKAAMKYNVDMRRLSNCCKKRYTYAGQLKDGTKLTWEYA